jgi:hypothetical protein
MLCTYIELTYNKFTASHDSPRAPAKDTARHPGWTPRRALCEPAPNSQSQRARKI